MVTKLEVAVREGVPDSFSEKVKSRIEQDLGIKLEKVKVKRTYIFDTKLSLEELERARKEVFTDEQTDTASFDVVPVESDYTVQVAWKPGVTDVGGRVSVEALEDLVGRELGDDEHVFTSLQICIKGANLTDENAVEIGKLYANEVVQDCNIRKSGDKPEFFVPKVDFNLEPKVDYVDLEVSDEELLKISEQRRLALSLEELHEIRDHFRRQDVKEARAKVSMLPMPTDAEVEKFAQGWSDHCAHKKIGAEYADVRGNIFEGIPNPEGSLEEVVESGGKVVRDVDMKAKMVTVNSLFDTYIKHPVLKLKERLKWLRSALKDNCGQMDFDDNWLYASKNESHNHPSGLEPYGGAYTGIVGVKRDGIAGGRGGRIIAAFYNFHIGSQVDNKDLRPKIPPKQMLEGVRKGVEDGGNRSGNPTISGYVYFDHRFTAKPYIGVGVLSLIPKTVNGEPGWEKKIEPGDLAIVVGGRVGVDGIHGATGSSLEASEVDSDKAAQIKREVQIGDAYLQKKVQEFLVDAQEKGLFGGIQDLGAGGVASAFGELADFTNGVELDISKHPIKYPGLLPWQILISESQERMAITAKPENLSELEKLAQKHDVELTVLGNFNNSGKFFIKYGDQPVAFLDVGFMNKGAPQLKIEAGWQTPEERGLTEPDLEKRLFFEDHGELLKRMLKRENIASYNYIVRQFDHEVQGGSVIKPLVGVKEDVHGDASVIRPVPDSWRGIAHSTGDNPAYGDIDPYHMVMANYDEAIRRIIAVGGDLSQVPMNDNIGTPNVLPAKNNPDARFKAAKLWRASKAICDGMLAYTAPTVSGKDSSSMDGDVPTADGSVRRISAPLMVQMSADALVQDVRYCLGMDPKRAGDLVYVLGLTKNELGGSEFYQMHGELGRNVPTVDTATNVKVYDAHALAAQQLLIQSSHGIYRGGLATHLALMSIAGDCGLEVDLAAVPAEDVRKDHQLLYSESAGRLVVTVAQENRDDFERLMTGLPYAQVGTVTADHKLRVNGLSGRQIIDIPVDELRKSYHSTFDGELNAKT
jgi:phosphoribosylformylglycinamidine synthase